MKDSVNTYNLYSPMPEHTIIEFIPGKLSADNSLTTPCHQVVLKQLNTGEVTTVDVSYCAILIGFRPDLQFLESSPQQQCGGDNTNINENINKMSNEQEILCNNDTNHIIITTTTTTKDSQFISMPYTLLSRKIAWLKNLCAKCKHLSICDRNNKQNLVNRQAALNRTLTTLCSCTNESETTLPAHQHHNHHHHHHHCCKHSPTVKNLNDNNNNIKNINCDKYHLFESKDGQQQQQQLDKKTNVSVVIAEPKSVIPPIPMGLGEDPTKPIDCKSNPIAVDKYSNEVINAPKTGLFAMGPLVGDNFIRFIPGGALAITSALWKQR